MPLAGIDWPFATSSSSAFFGIPPSSTTIFTAIVWVMGVPPTSVGALHDDSGFRIRDGVPDRSKTMTRIVVVAPASDWNVVDGVGAVERKLPAGPSHVAVDLKTIALA